MGTGRTAPRKQRRRTKRRQERPDVADVVPTPTRSLARRLVPWLACVLGALAFGYSILWASGNLGLGILAAIAGLLGGGYALSFQSVPPQGGDPMGGLPPGGHRG